CLISGVFSAALKVDELLTKEDTLKVLSTFSYINILKKDPILSFVPLQLPNGSFTDVPLVSDYESSNTDYLKSLALCKIWNL
ncbi:MAG: hypothetical protein MR629_01170, partial [Helicobacter sp.]|nr:hypothetical protein [Helicobacter sp.]